MVIAISANRTSATTAKTTPGPANRVARRPPSKATPVRITPIVATVAPSACSRGQRLPAQDDRQDDGEPAIRGDHAAHDRDRADPKTREIGEVGAGSDQSEQRGHAERARVRPGMDVPATSAMMPRKIAQMSWTAGRDPEAADQPAGQRAGDVHRAPRQGGTETGQESEGHRRSLTIRAHASSRPTPRRVHASPIDEPPYTRADGRPGVAATDRRRRGNHPAPGRGASPHRGRAAVHAGRTLSSADAPARVRRGRQRAPPGATCSMSAATRATGRSGSRRSPVAWSAWTCRHGRSRPPANGRLDGRPEFILTERLRAPVPGRELRPRDELPGARTCPGRDGLPPRARAGPAPGRAS